MDQTCELLVYKTTLQSIEPPAQDINQFFLINQFLIEKISSNYQYILPFFFIIYFPIYIMCTLQM